MKKRLFIPIVLILLSFVSLHGRLIDVYKKGVIKIIPDKNFGIKTDWESLIYDDNRSLLVVPDGSIFVANSNTHNFYKFSENGALLGTYGRKGAGTGDLYQPTVTSALDGKYLVLYDYPLSRKLNLFDFNGKYVAALRTQAECFRSTGLKNSVVAYYSLKTKPDKNNGRNESAIYIHILNIDTHEEKSFILGDYSIAALKVTSIYTIAPGGYLGEICMQRTLDGDLLTGISNSPYLRIFSSKGTLIKTIQLKIQPVPVTESFIEKKRMNLLNSYENRIKDIERLKRIRKAIVNADFTQFFGKYLPFYKSVLVDAEGNYLVFLINPLGNGNEQFQVYSPAGVLICETTLDMGEFNIPINTGSYNLQFAKDAIYGLFDCDDENGDPMTRLIKIKY